MLSFDNYANYNLKPSGLESDHEEDDGEMQPMLDDDDKSELTELGPLPPSDQSMLIFNQDQGTFHFDKRYLSKIPPIASAVMLAYAKSEGEKMKDRRNRAIACACLQPCLPAIVPGSPLISLLENTTPNIPNVEKQMYVSFVFSAYQLLDYKMAICDDVLPCALLTEDQKKQYMAEYAAQVKLNGDNLDRELDTLFARQSKPSLEEFTAVVEGFCITYINELERFLHGCLIAPYDKNIHLAHVLTPRVFPTLKQVPFDKREAIVQDVVRFFDYKQKEQKMDAITTETIMQEVKQEGSELYKAYLPVRTLRQYMQVMDVCADETPAA